MNAPDATRGRHLTRATGLRAFTGGLFARGFQAILDRIDHGLEYGSIECVLPDGSTRMLGGRGPGPQQGAPCIAGKRCCAWCAAARPAGMRLGRAGEWSSPDPVQIFDLFMRNRVSLGNVGRPSGMAKLVGSIMHALRDNSRSGARTEY